MRLKIDPITIGLIVLAAMLLYGNCQKAHAAEPWLDLALNTADGLKVTALYGMKVSEKSQDFSATIGIDSGIDVKVRGIAILEPGLFAGITREQSNNLPAHIAGGLCTFYHIVCYSYGYDFGISQSEQRVLFDVLKLGTVMTGAVGAFMP